MIFSEIFGSRMWLHAEVRLWVSWRLGALMVDQNLVLSNENGASNWIEDHTNVKPLQNHVKIHHFILGNKLNLMISKLQFQWNIIPSLKSAYSKPRKPQNEVYSTQGCSRMVLRHSTELASKYMMDTKGFDLNPWQHDPLVWNSSTPNMRGKFDVAWKLSPDFMIYVKFNFPLIHARPPSWLLSRGFIGHCARWTSSVKILSRKKPKPRYEV